MRRAGSRWKVYIATFEVPGGTRAHREQISRELIAVYHPGCNTQQYDQAWRDEWIGDYTAPATGSATGPTAAPGTSPAGQPAPGDPVPE